jgi:hypothetical protein
MTQYGRQDQMPIRAALITMPPDDPAWVANLARVLGVKKDFNLTILGYKPTSVFCPNFPDPITSLPMTGFAAAQFIKYGHGKTQLHCKEIWKYLEESLLENTVLEISYVSGRPHKVANGLKSMFDLFVVPRPFSPPSVTRHLFANVDFRLVRTSEVPILFWDQPRKWRRVVMMATDKDNSYEEIPVVNFLLRLLGGAPQEKQPTDMPTIGLHSDTSAQQMAELSSYGFVNAPELPPEEQAATILVISTKIACSVLRYDRLRKAIAAWRGSILVFPS